MKQLGKAALIGAGIAAVLLTAGAAAGIINVVLIVLAVAAVAAFIPLIVLAFTSKSMPKPTVYGTGKPNSMTTVSRAEASGEDPKKLERAGFWAVIGGALLLGMFAGMIMILA
ncbi:hypothetical protein [Alkalicoccus urumqiensis]|uniref:DUF3899 domain-containing protein n=1 Tax=Alkalicoccus urumqiensis TaxID=1548213 RepID=A0A2P6MIE5_ALKUR|nr:hypothetical protein [Alkalicoccus urumqiensis]PRO66064.1 hypothetical protein C6I21_07115 [Alkalicoccus urumqiensis]